MKRDVKEMIRYNPPDVPSGTLQINEANFFKFPIQEKSAHGLLGHLRTALKEAYNRGYDDHAKDERRSDLPLKSSFAQGRIKRVYLRNNQLMVASYSRHVTTTQVASLTSQLSLLVDQINIMLEEAEERGIEREQG